MRQLSVHNSSSTKVLGAMDTFSETQIQEIYDMLTSRSKEEVQVFLEKQTKKLQKGIHTFIGLEKKVKKCELESKEKHSQGFDDRYAENLLGTLEQ